MIEELTLNTKEGEEGVVVQVEWDDLEEDYIIKIHDGITRTDLIRVVELIKNILSAEY